MLSYPKRGVLHPLDSASTKTNVGEFFLTSWSLGVNEASLGETNLTDFPIAPSNSLFTLF